MYKSLWLVAAGVTGHRHDADDVVQEATLTALARWSDFQPGTNFRAWMSSFVRFVAMNHRRKAIRRGTESLIEQSITAKTDPRADVSSGSVRGPWQLHLDDRWMTAIEKIDPIARACLLLRVLDDLSYREIAACLQIPEGTAMSHVFRSKATLRRVLRVEGEVLRGRTKVSSEEQQQKQDVTSDATDVSGGGQQQTEEGREDA